ncbi:GGDEF domain-containing protein [Leptospira wolffii]|nr:diguanylate cyclase (GGDEF) domain protein [Leptospira wolffii serovar Khorat str. Khorat-H2]TGL47645.1 GGDEF domain-containing protein [Leptospira wolffii]
MKLSRYLLADFSYSKSGEIRKLRAADNDKSMRIIASFSLLMSTVLLLQNIFSPGIPEGHPIQNLYTIGFGSISIFSGIILAIFVLKESKDSKLSNAVTIIFATVFTLMTTSLTLVDHLHTKDYSAFCFGLLMLPLLIRSSFAIYTFIAALNLALFLFGYVVFLNQEINFAITTPVFAFTLASLGTAIMVEKARLNGNILRLQLEETNKNLKELSHKDPLTSLFNRRHLMESLHTLLSASRRYDFPLSVLLLDLDHFKKANDVLGHQAGDKLLANIGRLLMGLVRDCDVAARYGGEEFCVVLSNTNKEGARFVAERIRMRIETETFEEIPWTVTVSIGVATRESDESAEDFLKAADRKLYESKEGGRNRVSA